MGTPNDIITLRDSFAAAALSGIVAALAVARRADLNAAFDLPEGTADQKTAKAAAFKALNKELEKDSRLAYVYADAAIDYRAGLLKPAAIAEAA